MATGDGKGNGRGDGKGDGTGDGKGEEGVGCDGGEKFAMIGVKAASTAIETQVMW